MSKNSTQTIPYELSQEGALSLSWRDHFHWPLPISGYYAINDEFISRKLAFAAKCEGHERNIALLGNEITMAALIDAAFAINAETNGQPRLSGPPELDVLRGETLVEDMVERGAKHHRKPSTLFWVTLRQLARTASWSNKSHLLRNFCSPDVIALTHNRLLIDYAKKNQSQLRYRHGNLFLEQLMKNTPVTLPSTDISAFTDQFIDSVLHFVDLNPKIEQALQSLVRPLLENVFTHADHVLTALRNAKQLPTKVWTGNGGVFAGRAIGLEVLRRGGEAWRFDHGGTAALCNMPNFLAFQELAVSSHFVMPSRKAASSLIIQDTKKAVAKFGSVTVEGHTGDISLDVGPIWRNNQHGRPRRPRVLYVPTAYYGFFQSIPPVPPGIPYLEWQIRLIETLSAFPIEFAVKPHPEGMLGDRNLPYEEITTIVRTSFEEALRNTDILVMDMPASTTFSIALTTERPILLIDFGILPFNKEVAPEIEKRCRIIPVSYDKRNRAQLNLEALEEALFREETECDPTYFRHLFLDQEVD